MTNVLFEIERCMRRRKIAASRFGREFAGDPRFVFDLRRGRQVRPQTAARVLAFIAAGIPDVAR